MRLSDEVEKYKKSQSLLEVSKNVGNQEVKALTEKASSSLYAFEEIDVERKVFENMKQRYAKEKVFFDQRKFILEQELKFIKKQRDIVEADGNSICEASDRSSKLYRKLLESVNEEHR